MLSLFLALAAPAWSAGCENPAVPLNLAEKAIMEARLDDARTALDEVEQLYACSPVAAPHDLAQFWLLEGAWAQFSGDTASAEEAFASARALAPEVWNADLGPALLEQYQRATLPGGAPGALVLSPPLTSLRTYVDGQKQGFPAALVPGLHLVQIAPTESDAIYARVIAVRSGEEVSLVHNLKDRPPQVARDNMRTPPPPDLKPPREPNHPRKNEDSKGFPVFAAAGGGAVLLGAGALGLASAQNGAMREAEDLDALNAAWHRQQLFGWGGYSLLGLGLGLVSVEFAF